MGADILTKELWVNAAGRWPFVRLKQRPHDRVQVTMYTPSPLELYGLYP